MDSLVKSILVARFKRKPFPDSEPLMFSLKSQSRLFTWFLRSYILTNLFSIVSLVWESVIKNNASENQLGLKVNSKVNFDERIGSLC